MPDEGVIRGFRINRLDHALLGGVNIDASARLFTEVFGFDLSERLIDAEGGQSLALFLSCSTKPHDIAFVLQPTPGRFHHVSFLLESVTDVIHAADLIGKYTSRWTWAPTAMASPAARRSTSSTRQATATKSSPVATSITRTARPSPGGTLNSDRRSSITIAS